jgi:transposase InsO family protein
MPHKRDRITTIHICHSLWKQGVSPEQMPHELGIHRATVYRWIRGFQRKGLKKFIRDYVAAKKGRRQPRKTDPVLKARVFTIRDEYKRCCGEKIQFILKRDYQSAIAVATIYRILGTKYQLRSKWKKYSIRGFVRKGEKPREVIQTDSMDLGHLYAFTAIDTFTKEASVVIASRLTATAGRDALKAHLAQFTNIDHIQRDGGSEFKREWQEYALKHISSIRTARPYKKNEQAFIERFNGVLRKECLGYLNYKKRDLSIVQQQVNEYLEYYHTKRPHLSLNMQTPKEFAMSHLT